MNKNRKYFKSYMNSKLKNKVDVDEFCRLLTEYSVVTHIPLICVYQWSIDLELGYEDVVEDYLKIFREFYG